MGKSKKEKRQAYFFDNKALLALILPLVVEQLLAVLVGKHHQPADGKECIPMAPVFAVSLPKLSRVILCRAVGTLTGPTEFRKTLDRGARDKFKCNLLVHSLLLYLLHLPQ